MEKIQKKNLLSELCEKENSSFLLFANYQYIIVLSITELVPWRGAFSAGLC